VTHNHIVLQIPFLNYSESGIHSLVRVKLNYIYIYIPRLVVIDHD
jgi:hypothetical protein